MEWMERRSKLKLKSWENIFLAKLNQIESIITSSCYGRKKRGGVGFSGIGSREEKKTFYFTTFDRKLAFGEQTDLDWISWKYYFSISCKGVNNET